MGEFAPCTTMIEGATTPRNHERFNRLMAFTREVLAVCDEVGVKPIMDGSLAVFAYTQDPAMEVHDVDFSCSESDFPRLRLALQGRGIHCEIKDWHVLQTRRDGLKVEFGAVEHWNRGIPNHHETARIGGVEFRVISFEGLREQYRRGLENTADNAVDSDPGKHRAISEKLRLLDALQTSQ